MARETTGVEVLLPLLGAESVEPLEGVVGLLGMECRLVLDPATRETISYSLLMMMIMMIQLYYQLQRKEDVLVLGN